MEASKVFMDGEVIIPAFRRKEHEVWHSERLVFGMPQAVFRAMSVSITELVGKPVICLAGRYIRLDEFRKFELVQDFKDEKSGERYQCRQAQAVPPGEMLSFLFVNETDRDCSFQLRVDGITDGPIGRVGYFRTFTPNDELLVGT